MKLRTITFLCILLILFFSTFLIPKQEKAICYWEISERTNEERNALNWIFESPMFADDSEEAAILMAKYASLMGYDYIGTNKYNEECGVGCHGYWASNTMYGVVDWVPDDPRTVCLRANVNEDFPCFISWRMGEERDPSTLTEEDKLRYLNGEFLSYWIDVQRDDVINMYLAALQAQPCYELQWDQIEIIYFDEFTSSGFSYIDKNYNLIEDDYDIDFRCHECHKDTGIDGCGHDYNTVEEGRLVMEAKMIELAHEHGVKIIASGGREWFENYLPYIHGEKPESEWPYEIPLERYRAAEPDYFVIEPDLGDPGTQEYEWSQPDYTSAEPYAIRVYAGSPRPGDPNVGIDSEKNIFTVDQVIFRVGYLASKGFWFGPNSESMNAIQIDPELGKKTAVKPFLKAIPNWENLNDVLLHERSFDMESYVYESPVTHIDANIIYSQHPFTGDFHVIFMDDNAAYDFEGDWDEYNVYRTTSIWERETEAKGDLNYDNGKVILKDKTQKNVGYIITKNTYKTIEELNSKHDLQGLVMLSRALLIVGIILVFVVSILKK